MSIISSIVLLIVSVVLTELLRPKPRIENARPSGLGDFKFPTATEARAEPIIFGRVLTEGMNVVWFDNLTPVPIPKKIKKNLWSSFTAIIGHKYFVGIQGGIGRGPLGAVRKFYVGDQVVWSGAATTGNGEVIQVSLPELFGGNEVGTGGVEMDLQIYLGSPTQTANDYLQAFQADKVAGNAQPTYAGSAYVIARKLGSTGLPIPPGVSQGQFWTGGAYIGNTDSLKPWKFEIERFPAAFPGQAAGTHILAGADANPANVIYEVLTNTEWGCRLPAGDIDTGAGSTFAAAAATLHGEGNGFAYLLTVETDAGDFLAEIERQIDGIVFLNHLTGKWQIKLARADYVLASQPLIDDSNIVELRDFTRGAIVDTVNQVQVEYDNRANEYKVSNALAQDMANMLMQGGGSFSSLKVVPGKLKFPGVKTSVLAQKVASRELRERSFPLAKGTAVVNRALYTITVGTVVRFSRAALGLSELPMRVLKIDFGTIDRNQMTLWMVQDVFIDSPGLFGPPSATLWTYPTTTLAAYAAADQLAFEAPRALVVRDPDFAGDEAVGKIFAAVSEAAGGVSAAITARSAVGTPSGSYSVIGQLRGFMPVGRLLSAMGGAVAAPGANFTIVPDPSTQQTILDVFDAATTLGEMGTGLTGLLLIDNEFVLVRTATVAGLNATLQTVYRGVLDSVQTSHAVNARVYLVTGGAGLSEGAITSTHNVDVELRQQTESATFVGAAIAISFAMAKRALRPYPPGAVLYNGSGTPFTVPSLEGAGSGLGGRRIDVAWWRKNFRTVDELLELTRDNAVDASTEYRLTVRADPLGADVLVGAASAWTAGTGPLAVARADILTAAPAGTLLRFLLRARHDIGTDVDLESRNDFVYDVTPSSEFSGLFYAGGGVAANVATTSYTAAATGNFTVNIGTAQATAAIEVSVAGGGFATVIAAAATTGIVFVTSGQGIRLRRTVNEAPHPNVFEIRAPSTSVVAYGTFSN